MIGIDIGGTKCLGVLLDAEHRVVAEHRVPTPRTGPEVVASIAEVAGKLCADPDVPIGIGAPGLVDAAGSMRFCPHLPGVVELQIKADLLAGPLPGRRIVVDNDATCAVWAETVCGAAIGRTHVLMVTLGTGIGGGLVADGRVQRGRNGFAGEIGHTLIDPAGPPCPCGRSGCWERYASGSALGMMAREAAAAGTAGRVLNLAGGDPSNVTGEHVTAAAAEGDEQAWTLMARYGWWVAAGLVNLSNVLDPEVIVLGGGLIEAGDILLGPVRRAFAELLEGTGHRPEIPIVPAVLGERAGAIGAALLAGTKGA